MSSGNGKPEEMSERISFDDVFQDELEAVKARWENVYQGERAAERQLAERRDPTTEHGLVGLGLSGGGIRSTSFNLGILQSLVRRGVFEHVDHMSTVSGGGCLGAAVSAGMARNNAGFPFPYVWGPREHPNVTWLRNHSNYMVSEGFIDWLRIVAVLVRGILLNVLVILPVLMAIALLMGWVHGDHLRDWRVAGIDYGEAFRYTLWSAIGAVTYFVAYAPSVTLVKLFTVGRSVGQGVVDSLEGRNRHELSHAYIVLIVLLVAVFEMLPVLLHYYHALLDSPALNRDLLAGLGSAGSVVAGTVVARISSSAATLLKQVLLYALGLVGLILPLILILFFAENLVYAQGLLADAAAMLDIAIVYLVLVAMFGLWLFARLFIDVNLTSIHGLFRDRLAHACRVGRHPEMSPDQEVGAVTRDLPLTEICPPGSKAPYHLVNTALNLQGSDDPNIRERLASHFILSKHYSGGQHCGYMRTSDLEAINPTMDLAVAMAISAGAASPNMGSYTMRSLTALMVLLNVRLGYWVPNPAALTPWAVRKGRPWAGDNHGVLTRAWHRLRWILPPRALLAEMAGRIHDRGRFVNLSDGGHLENLGGIELLRRRCKYIIIGDAEADPEHQFGGLAMLMRQARLDLGIEIEILLDGLRLGETGCTREHCTVGRIIYPGRTPDEGAEDGYLIYIKLSITDDEDEVIRQYGAANPEFPHESTADQFFDEGQFEAYRSLGFHAAETLFPLLQPDAGQQTMTYDELHEWFMRHLQAKAWASGERAGVYALSAVGDAAPGVASIRTGSAPTRPELLPQGPMAFGFNNFDAGADAGADADADAEADADANANADAGRDTDERRD